MIDIHSHILPGIDDGAKSMESTLSMLQIAKESGTEYIFATPHYYPGIYDNDFEKTKYMVDKINGIVTKNAIDIKVLPGQEIYIHKNTLMHYKQGLINGLNGSKYILLELPMDKLPALVLDTIYELGILGVRTIIAHPERYNYIIEKPSRVNRLLDEGCLFQINTGSISGIFGSKVKKTADTLLKNHICHFIASDAHSTGNRSPRMVEAYNIVTPEFKNVLINNAKQILNNADITDISEKMVERKSFIFRLKNNLRI